MRSYNTLMRYSLRSLMIAVTLICVVLGSVLGWIRYGRSQISIATGRWDFLEENFGWGPKAEARAGTVV